jgi:glycosyltransferase involved in cell wall biosynthesis
VVHAHDPELVSVLLLLRLVGRKVVFDVHENIAQQVLEKEWIATFWRRPLSRVVAAALRWLPRMADAVILAEDSYLRDFPPLPNVTVIHNFPLTPRRYKHEYNSDRLRLIYVGDVRKVRGVIEYVSILARLRELGVPAELRIVGSFAARHEEDETQRMVRRLQLESSVRFLGRRPPEEIAELILDCDVGLALLHPIGNYRESYPTKMFEYMAVGLPVVASRFPLWERVLVDNDCGSVVDPLNVEEGTAAVHNYWVSGELRERHGRNGRLAALTQYSWQREALRLLAVYSTLTDPGNLRSG